MRYKLLILFILFSLCLHSQDNVFPKYPNPVKIPVYLSATFAELRSDAFHAGVDIKTQGVEGKEVFAVADGYVSRIGVSPYGYGKVIYITHYDGFTSVYAHLSKFNKKISDYVKSKQYEDMSFIQNIILEEGQFPIKRGDYLGFTGNSGSSGGPHLHYELRYTESQEPLNPLYFGLKVKDTKKPTIKGLAIYPLENSSVNNLSSACYQDVVYKENTFVLKEAVFEVNGDIAFGINVYDKADDTNNKNGVYSIELYADNNLIFNIVSDKFSYNETRYINSLIDYSYYVKNGERYIRSEVDKFNKLSIYENKDGIVSVKEGETINMRYVIKDYNENISTLNFTLKGVKNADLKEDFTSSSTNYKILDGKSVDINLDGLEVKIPEYAFYKDIVLETSYIDSIENKYSDYAYQIGSEEIPLHKRITLRMRPKDDSLGDTTLYLAYINKKGEFQFLGNKVVDNFLEARTNVLGVFAIAKDSISPTIKPLNFNDNSSISENWSLRFEIDDKESGINKYDMYINGEWVVADYDAKNRLLMYQIDEHIKKGYNDIKVVVTDMLDNECVYSTTLHR